MVIESIRQFNAAIPFSPYEIHLADGRMFAIPHPDFISISPKGSYIVVIDSNERPWHISSLLISSVSPLAVGAR